MRRRPFTAGYLIAFIGCCFVVTCTNPKDAEQPSDRVVGVISIIPQPNSVKRIPGEFEVNEDTKIVIPNELAIVSSLALNEILIGRFQIMADVVVERPESNFISINLVSNDPNNPSVEAYTLKVEPKSIEIRGTERGVFYAIQSLSQMLPEATAEKIKIPGVEISDSPRFAYRGMHLDVARHFMPVSFVKKYIGLISLYKFNYFHWHLTDDQGWRIEIKKYPKLTGVGSFRHESVLKKNYDPYVGDRKPVSGFYSQDEIREIVEYAKSKHVTIVPEIDMPGHTSAALAAYPQFGCKDNYPYRVQTTWGGFSDILCPKEETFRFIEEVLGEVFELFPDSPMIHIGGDEIETAHWKQSTQVQALMKREGLKSEHDLQHWFIERVERFVNSKGRNVIVWDEVLGARLSGNATVMAWQDEERVVDSAKAQKRVIATPSDFTYFDHPQGNPESEPLGLGNTITLEDVYGYDPVPAALGKKDAEFVIGAQGCVWTEFIKNPKAVEYMAFPRSIALAEVLWSKKKNRKFSDFLFRLNKERARLDREQVKYKVPKEQKIDYGR